MYQNDFLEGFVGELVLLKCWAGPTAASAPRYTDMSEGVLAVAEPNTLSGYFILEGYDEVGLTGCFSSGGEQTRMMFVPWEAILSIQPTSE